MSFDLNLTTQCNHEIFRELNVLEDDRKTLRLERPIAATSTVKVYVTDNLLPSSMYRIIDDPDDQINTIDLGRKIIFLNNKWKSPSDYFEITYLTLSSYCPKCANSNYLDDISYNVKGGLLEIRNEHLLMQNVEKFTITRINSNPFHLFIGTSLITLIGTKITSISFLVSQITNEINRTLQKFRNLQDQYRLTGRAITDGETLQSVQNITVTQDESDPTIMLADVSVIAASGETVEFTQQLKIR